MKIGFIGMGNMGTAILNGLLTKYPKEDFLFSCRRVEHAEEIKKSTGINAAKDNVHCAKCSDILILAVKPQVYPEVLAEIKPVLNGKQMIISLAPGFAIADLKKELGEEIRIIRIMPNTPALLKEGMTGVSYNEKEFSASDWQQILEIMSSFGKMVKVEEKLMDAVVAVSGSSPAFVYLFIDALADAGVRYGLKKSDALMMAAQTVYGSAKMVLETGEHPAVLKDRVCSPGGTTIAGVAALKEAGFESAVMKGCDAVYQKCHNVK